MFQPFVWMFKAENFRKRTLQLFFTMIILCMIGFLLSLTANFFNFRFFASFEFPLLFVLFFLLIPIIFLGYFWEVTYQVISREGDVVANNIYSGNINRIYKITLPDFNFVKLMWRGIASIVALILFLLPYLILSYLAFCTSYFVDLLASFLMTFRVFIISLSVLFLFCIISLPAVFWNYAAKNSVTAVWELRRIIYLMESYPKTYIINLILLVFVYIMQIVITVSTEFLVRTFVVNNYLSLIVQIIITLLMNLYLLYVYAYLIGIIAPPEEA